MTTQNADTRPTPGVTFILGPPRDPGQKALFEAFQEPAEPGAGEAPWMAAEREAIAHLFERGANGHSIAEQIFREASGAELRLEPPFLGASYHAGKRVVAATLKGQHVRASGDAEAAWPPSQATVKRAAAMLQYVLGREWIAVLVT